MFIAIEGADCCGKGVQSEFLADRLGAKLFRFPDRETPIGALINDHLFNRWSAVGPVECNACDAPSNQSRLLASNMLDPMVFQCLQTVNRMEHAPEIFSLTSRGKFVVADRYLASGIIYGGADGLDVEYIKKTQEWLPQPDVSILLDIDIEEVKKRMRERGDPPDRYEADEENLKDVILRYRQLWSKMQLIEGKTRWPVVDSHGSKVEVAAEIIAVVKKACVTYQSRRFPKENG